MTISKIKLNKDKRGFTLIELLVVISIIGLLSSIVLASLQDARAKGRDAKRLSDMRQIQNALELYRSQNNTYPTTSIVIVGNTTDPTFKNLLLPHIKTLPIDPKSTDTQNPTTNTNTYNYWYYGAAYNGCAAGQGYFLTFRSEKMNQSILNGPSYNNCTTGLKFTGSGSTHNGLWMTGIGK